MRFHVVTLGCDKNTVDSERYAGELLAHGAEHVAEATDADLIVVNTCGFIDAAKKESIDAILEAARLKEDGSCRLVAAVGCMIQRHRGELEAALPEVDLFLGTSESDRLVEEVRSRGLLDGPLAAHPGVRAYAGELPHIRYLKISEGCDHGCAFCAIPLMRGKHRSFGLGALVREAQLLEAQGAREINLVAQDLAHYGRDVRDGQGLAALLRGLVQETSIPWLRLLYIYSAGLTDEVVELLASERRVVPYLDIPMQHASDAVLQRMRRPERQQKQREVIARLRSRIPGLAIRTTVIVGFPGETETEFEELLAFLEEVQLERVGAFTYSPQEGTRAWAMADDVPDAVKRERLERVQELQRHVTAVRYAGLIGTERRMMVDRILSDGAVQGRLDIQADDIDGVTVAAAGDAGVLTPGTLVDVRVDDVVDDYDFAATVIRAVDRAPVARANRQLPLASLTLSDAFGREPAR